MLPKGRVERMIGAMPRRVSSPTFVGRVAERALLSEALERAVAGRPGMILVSGEAGVGKSRLLTEVTALSAEMGMAALSGMCFDVAAGTLPYAPFIEIVRQLHRLGLTASLPAATRTELGRIVPDVSSARSDEARAGQSGGGRVF